MPVLKFVVAPADEVYMRERSHRLVRILSLVVAFLWLATHALAAPSRISARQVSIADVATGRFEDQWVTFTGTVRHCVARDGAGAPLSLRLSVAASGQSLEVVANGLSKAELARIIDSTVRVRGVASSYRNRRGQFLVSMVTAVAPGHVAVIEPGPADPFEVALQPIGNILTASDKNRGDHRVRTRGVVTYYLPGHELFIQDGGDAVLVQTSGTSRLRTGETVDVVGFEAAGDSSPHLEDGIVRHSSEQILSPTPLRTVLTQVVEGELDARLVQISGVVFDVVQRPTELLIILQSGKNMIGAYLQGVQHRNLPAIQAGAKVELTGVASLILDENHKPKSFTMRLRSTSDARVLQAAPWWTTKKAITMLGAAGSLIFLIAGWVILLRKRVHAQTRLIRATLDGTADAILVLDNEHRYVDANEKFRTMWDVDLTPREPCSILDRISPRLTDPEALERLLAWPRPQGQTKTILMLRTGEIYECDREPIPGSSAGGVVLSFRDITGRRKSERLERDRNRILEAISREDPLHLILPAVCRLAEQQEPAIRCSIRLTEANQGAVAYRGATDPAGFGLEFDAVSYPLLSSANKELGELVIASSTAAPAGRALMDVIAAASRLASIAIEHRRLFEQLDHLAYHDPLTALSNRGALDVELDRAIQTARNANETFALLCIDLDRFKQINDTLSHRTGDLFICAVAERLTQLVTAHGARVFRVGGDEFIILSSSGTGLSDAEQIARSVLEGLRRPFPVGDRLLHTTASIGISQFPRHGETPAALQQAADSAMYKAKHGGKDQHKVFLAEWRVQEDGSFEMEALLREAIESSWFEIHYQPKLTKGRRICGLEALIRLKHPEIGLIPPDKFITIAEDSGLIPQIGAWALDEVCRQITLWRAQGVTDCRVAVNVSAAQFARGDFFKTVQTTLERWNLPGEALELELTESLLMKNIAEATELMAQLRRLGIVFAIDDFGTGYSSLGYLHSLPVSTLKVDRTFVAALMSPESSEPLVKTILQLARSLGLEVVAEGVETEEQFSLLKRMECDQFQGYLFSRPRPAAQIEELMIRFGQSAFETATSVSLAALAGPLCADPALEVA